MNQEIATKVAKLLLEIKAVKLSPTKPFKYASGILSPIYTDCRMLISFPKQRKEAIDAFVSVIHAQNLTIDVIAGTATAGIPHAAWVADKLDLPMIYVRSKPKDHGTGSLVEGVLNKNQTAIVIEDLISTGGSSAQTVDAIRSEGAVASHIFAITTYGMKKATEVFSENNISLTTLTNFETIVTTAATEGYIKEEEKELILDWATDPTGWAVKKNIQ